MTTHRQFRAVLRTGASPRDFMAWAIYDFTNSGYTTVVITALFNAYFVAVVAGNVPWVTFAWAPHFPFPVFWSCSAPRSSALGPTCTPPRRNCWP